MIFTQKKTLASSHSYDTVVVPFLPEGNVSSLLPDDLRHAAEAALSNGLFDRKYNSVCRLTLCNGQALTTLILVGTGDPGRQTKREIFLAWASAFKLWGECSSKRIAVFLENAGELSGYPDILKKICELSRLVPYRFLEYKTTGGKTAPETVDFITQAEGFEEILAEACICAESSCFARDLVNHPSMYMTPARLAEEALRLGNELQIDTEILDEEAMKSLGMGAFLEVAKGAADRPELIVMRYRGGNPKDAPLGLIGKGVMFDSGGYSIKSTMHTMHGDMAGAAAALGALKAIAACRLKINVTLVIAACKNMISGDAYVPGDILRSMSGKTIEMVNADAEGRLTLADAITYALSREGADRIIDIATLTGAAAGAVGNRCAVIMSNDDAFCRLVQDASGVACERVWRLDTDKELLPAIDSDVADIKNSSPGNPMGGGAILGGLFLEKFVEEKPWVHLDIAPVFWMSDKSLYGTTGGSGFGVSLLYETAKRMQNS